MNSDGKTDIYILDDLKAVNNVTTDVMYRSFRTYIFLFIIKIIVITSPRYLSYGDGTYHTVAGITRLTDARSLQLVGFYRSLVMMADILSFSLCPFLPCYSPSLPISPHLSPPLPTSPHLYATFPLDLILQ